MALRRACGYPLADAARVALKTMNEYLKAHPEVKRVRFVLFGKAAYAPRRPSGKDYRITEIKKTKRICPCLKK
jgi:hypothetical protein